METTYKAVIKVKTPEGRPQECDFAVEEKTLPTLKEGEVAFKTLFISPDPYQRGVLYSIPNGATIVGSVVGEVTESKNPKIKVGEYIVPYCGWASGGIVKETEVDDILCHDPSLGPVSTALGVLGMPGMTAYFGLLKVCSPKEGETVVVSGAAGAVGSLVGQIAKIKGCTVIGIAGSDEKCDYIKSLGFDHAINYQTCGSIKSALNAVAPGGVDCFFDNVGGEALDAVLQSIKPFARIAICGQISEYDNLSNPSMGPRLFYHLIYKNASVVGFVVRRWASEWPEGIKQMSEWIKEGKIKYQETIFEGGIEVTPKAFINLLSGGNIGKQLVKLTE